MRIRLILALAEAIAVACEGQRVTYANAKRYVTRDFLTKYRVRRNTEIRSAEWICALEIAQEERSSRLIDNVQATNSPDCNRIKLIANRLPKFKRALDRSTFLVPRKS